jgi:pectate lyase
MKWFSPLLLLGALQVVYAVTIEKRASANDVANIGYATLNGGTSGGSGGTTTTVSTLAALTSAVAGDSKKIVIVSGTITGNTVVKVGSNTSILGKAGSSLVGVGLRIIDVNNVIVRNMKISKVLADVGDALAAQNANHIWFDHNDLSSDKDHDKDYYDGLLDVTHGCTGVTISNNKFTNHYKGSLVGHSDSNQSEDTKITVTYTGNYWDGMNSRTPSFRFGTGHIFNEFYTNNGDGINTRVGAQLLVENNVWENCKNSVYSTDGGFATVTGSVLSGTPASTAPIGTFKKAPYSYTLLAGSAVKASVQANAGQKLSF